MDDFGLFLAGYQFAGPALASPELFAALSEFVKAGGLDIDLSTVPETGLLPVLALVGIAQRRRRR